METEVLRRRVQQSVKHATPFAGTFFRAVSMEYANRNELLTGSGAKRFGGRWNPPGLFRVIYGALDPYGAIAESIGVYGQYNIPFEQRLPLVLVAVDARLQQVLDLTRGLIRRSLNVSEERMLHTDWQASQSRGEESLTQTIGRIAWELKLEGLLVPSARIRGGKNLIVFPDNLKKASALLIINRHQLPASR